MKICFWKLLALLSPILVLLSACADQHIPLVGSPAKLEEEAEIQARVAQLTTDEVADRVYRDYVLPGPEDGSKDELYDELVKDWKKLKADLQAMSETERLFRTRTIGRLLSLAGGFESGQVKSTRTLIVHFAALRYATKLTTTELANAEKLAREKIFTSFLTMLQVVSLSYEIYEFTKHPEKYDDEQKVKAIQVIRNFDHAMKTGKLD